MEILKAILFGIVEGITEWLPISSTGHLILLDEFVKLNVTPEFKELFEVVIQLGAILAVVCIYFKTLFPWGFGKDKEDTKNTLSLWLKIIVACLPAAVIGFLFDDWFESHFFNPETVAIALIVYGVIFIVIENVKKFSSRETRSINTVTYKEAFGVGLFQILALIPGTSRSGSTIIGGLLFGMDRKTAADFTFILAIPVMAGASLLKLIKYLKSGLVFNTMEIEILVVASVIAFLVSMVVIKFFLDYIRKHNFKPFGWYRIALGILVLVYFFIIK
ncbi:MAG: undecaprenyl-diphosphate phosphatase [Bacilli bacterium]|nr:undecaprenyl-diphosphate phosphatase [Bacilli bacterium]